MIVRYASGSFDEKFSMVYFKMKHENCWSRITEKYDISIHTLKLLPYKDKNAIYGIFEIRVNNKHNLKEFLRSLNKESTIKNVTSLNLSELKRSVYIMDLYENYDGMIQGKLNDYNSIFYFDIVKGGLEEKYAVLPSENVKELKNDLQSLGDLYEFRAKYLKNFYDILAPYFTFSPIEMQIIVEAYNHGYYDIPRKTGIRELADSFGLSKSTVQEYIRSAEAKALSSIKLFKLMDELKEG
ncbi:helix-turn-helix domain-containing protein [Picrophilus oshimae]|uniref:HTH bat-type domain-containing protein n=1 Tax=Picrophilus torridus (strain ATCC 700027 / DSM 9790 / JCM 10055 / NBRC 100828 / KAW 2/3) TaxID=1122961 RepID=A0A8G2FXZ8_PICTO|nr:helix-turn-helix domain-containing protein [Picrophilus oshimae]SMD31466.1 hypothetical protein SAMN02745355_1408 [Picrophilus oshimae DSM 9789]